MNRILLLPLQGVIIDDSISIDFGLSMADIVQKIGEPEEFREIDFNDIQSSNAFYGRLGFGVEYDASGSLVYIEFFSSGLPPGCKLTIYDIDPFAKTADEVVEALTTHAGSEVNLFEAPSCYDFPTISIRLSRENSPEDLDDIAEETYQNDISTDKAEFDRLRKQSHYFDRIGLGIADSV